MPIDRSELERLLADRPAGNRSAMQAVRDSYADIGLMRERGLSWADISEMLARLGVTARDQQPISPVTLRSAFFLVGNEVRSGSVPAEAEAASATPPETLDAVHRAALETGLVRPDAEGHAGDAAAAAEPAPSEPVADAVQAEVQDEPPVEPPGEPDAAAPAATLPDTVPEPTPEPTPAIAEHAEGDAMPDRPAERDAPAVDLRGPPPPAQGTAPPAEPAGRTEPAQAVVPVEPTAAVAAPRPPQPSPRPAALTEAAEVNASRAPEATDTHWKGDRMLGTIFVLNDRGGVGKTLLSHHLMATAMLEGLQLRVVEYEVNERLARLFGTDMVEHRKITQDFMNMMGSGDGFYEFWDQIGPELQRGGRLFDFGGNISQWFFNWAEVSGFDYYVGEGERLTFMVPVTVDLASLQTGMATLERIATIAPKARRVLVENGISGPFSQLEDSNYGRRKTELMEREGVHVIAMPPCTAPAWAKLTGHRIDQVAVMTREDLAKLGMTPPVASRSLIVIHEWLRTMRQALAPYLHDAFRAAPASARPAGTPRLGAD